MQAFELSRVWVVLGQVVSWVEEQMLLLI